MSTPQIVVVVSPTGESQVGTQGFIGPGCREATRALEMALGTRRAELLTTEYHLTPTEEARIVEQSDGLQ